MTYATVMVSLALGQPNEAALAVAGDLAEKFGARVIGIAAAEFSPPLYYTSGEAAEQLVERTENEIRAHLSDLEQVFRAAMSPRAKSVEWRSALTLPADFVAEQARAADVIVCGRAGASLTDPFDHADPDDLVMQAGRPLLIAPAGATWLDLRRGMVAWKDTPEARRAVAAALPLLKKVGDITVVEIIEDDDDRPQAEARIRDVIGWLRGHGINATAMVPQERGDAAQRLDRIAADLGAGVIVAGAYGHSRLREWVFGGVTRRLVSEVSRCALVTR
jgi:nucleotide-binding universal stress UspA family protein